jgi:type IV pilus assembly protein PilB
MKKTEDQIADLSEHPDLSLGSESLSLLSLDQLGEKLIEEKLLTSAQLQIAKDLTSKSQIHLGSALMKLGYLTEEVLLEFLARVLNIPHVDLKDYEIDPKVIPLASSEIAHRYKFIPLFKIEDTVTIAMADPLDLFALDRIKFEIAHKIEPVICSEKSVMEAIKRFYPLVNLFKTVIDQVQQNVMAFEDEDRLSKLQLERIAEEPPIVKLVNTLISQAIQMRASDIHIEPQEHEVKVRFRVDGILRRMATLPKSASLPVISRVKILSHLDITQRRKPQDGRIRFEFNGKPVNLRISVYTGIFGEKVVIRILDLSKAQLHIADLGMPAEIENKFSELIQKPHGIFLVTGPTGSGKTTTLYAALNSVNTEGINITTVEDPVEYQLENITQANVDEKYGITFAAALRSILRQDPDIILVGEIRDVETAQLAIRAALTGHLVFSTLHTNDATGAITRLLNLEIEPFLVATSLVCILAQRLVRVICPNCKYSYHPKNEILKELNWEKKEEIVFYRGKGCPACDDTGYKGRLGIFELLTPNEEISQMIMAKASPDEIKKQLSTAGVKTLRDDGLEKVLAGVTTIEEVLKVTTL